MAHVDTGHKVLDILQHIWPYVAGGFAVVLAGIKILWSDRRSTRKRILHIETLIEVWAEKVVTHDDLDECKKDITESTDRDLNRVVERIEKLDNNNADQHERIINKMIELYGRATGGRKP